MENNYIVTTANENVDGQVSLTWDNLHAANFSLNKPFKLQLTGGQVFVGTDVMRIMPGRRLVAFGKWQGKPAVAKLFFDTRHAKRHMERDVAGVKLLLKNKTPTPALYYEGICKDKQIHVLIFERITNAQSLDDIWQNRTSITAIMPRLKAIMVELATQHVLGVKQRDLHFKNFLLTENTIYTLDGAQIELLPEPLNIKLSMDNVALFLSQLGVGVESYQDELFKHYATARSWLLKKEDMTDLFHAIGMWNKLRWKRFEKKIFRDSSNFARLKNKKSVGMYDRQYASPELMALLANPDSIFTHATAQLLKVGGSSTVVKVTVDGRDLVVKRYNIKDFRHFLRRCLRKTRAYKSWRLAQKLILFGIPTATPVAFLEEKYLGLRGKSYFIAEYVSSQHAGDFFLGHRQQEDKIAIMTKRITKLLNSITKIAITHGDLKITNILIDKNEQPVLIDLDGAIEHSTVFSLERARKSEIQRFLRNFLTQPSIHGQFKLEFGE